jgi:hypothetical protein
MAHTGGAASESMGDGIINAMTHDAVMHGQGLRRQPPSGLHNVKSQKSHGHNHGLQATGVKKRVK